MDSVLHNADASHPLPNGVGEEGKTVLSNSPDISAVSTSETASWLSGEIQIKHGASFAHYTIEEPLGEGGMGMVWKAKEPHLDRHIALKLLPPKLAKSEDYVKRFQNEAKSAAKLDHQNIARVYASGTESGIHYIAMEYVEGKTLKQLLDAHQSPLPVNDVLKFASQIARALAHMEERKVTHRDIKPSNIIVLSDGTAKLVDLGLARQSEIEAGGLTHSGATLGSFDYIAPEQALDPRNADVRSDIYALGCTMYHLLTGFPPVPEGTPARKLQAHQQEKAEDPRTLNPNIPESVVTLLAMMMAKKPEDRLASPTNLIAKLQELISNPMSTPLTEITSKSEITPWWSFPVSILTLIVAIFVWHYFTTSNSLSPSSINPSAFKKPDEPVNTPIMTVQEQKPIPKFDAADLSKGLDLISQLASNWPKHWQWVRKPSQSTSKPAEKESIRKLIIDGQGTKPDCFISLVDALEAIGPMTEATIELRTSLKINSLLRIGSRRITIRSAGDSLQSIECDSNAINQFFEVHKGELIFENVHLEHHGAESCVTMTHEGKCRFVYCLITLDQPDSHLIQINATNEKQGNRTNLTNPSRCEWERTLIRGGQLVKVVSPRPIEISLVKSAVALQGYLLQDAVENQQDTSIDVSNITIQNSTCYTMKGLVKLVYGVKSGIADQYRWNVTESILNSDQGSNLVRVSGAQSEQDLTRRFIWQGNHNIFCVSGSYLEWRTAEASDMTQQFDARRWSEFWGRGDDGAIHLRELLFEGLGLRDKSIQTVTPRDFQIKRTDPQSSDVQERGVIVSSLPRI